MNNQNKFLKRMNTYQQAIDYVINKIFYFSTFTKN